MRERLQQQNPWLKARALSWLARLPFLDAYELSRLLNVTEKEVQWLLHDLGNIHWVDQVTPSSPEFTTLPLHVLAASAVSAFSCQLDIPENEVETTFAVGHRDEVRRLTRLEAYTFMNRIFAELAYDLHKEGLRWLAELRARPLARRSDSIPWWPPGTEGYGCLRSTLGWAPFFVAMDRPDAPLIHRRKRIADWYTFRDEGRGWGDYWLPPIFIVTSSAYASDQWAKAVQAAAGRRQVNTLEVWLADIDTVFSKGFVAGIWDDLDGVTESNLHRCLHRISELDATFAPWLRGDEVPMLLSPTQPKLQAWANQVVVSLVSGTPVGTAEALGGSHSFFPPPISRAIEGLGRHPLLTASELGVMLKVDRRRAERLVAGLLRDHLIEALPPLKDEPSGEPRYILAELALKLLAARDGVPFSTYLRNAPFTGRNQYSLAQHRLGPLLYHPEHTAGANRFFISMLDAPEAERPRLMRWFGPAESTFWLTHDGSRNWLQPDGLGDLHWQNQTRRFFLEWDRGTMRWREMSDKFRRYASLYTSFARSANPWTPDTVIVTSTPQRESSIWECWQSTMAESDCPPSLLLTSIESLVTRLGPFAKVWRTRADDLRRRTWAEAIDLWETERTDSTNQQLEDDDD
ncbi:MAG: hypothetical protein GEU75_17560 [Dehalococcoidia bacterium]|nr:hypothetical protein [Dehalococcoidia bacterium]